MLSSRSSKLFGSLCAIVGALSVAGCDKQSNAPAQPDAHELAAAARSEPAAEPAAGTLDTSHKGEALPSVTVSDAAGKKLDIASLKGKPVLINLWATWCGPCVAELPTLGKLATNRAQELRVVTVSQDLKTDKVAGFLKEKGGADLPPWLDADTALSFKYQLQSLPASVFYDASGKEVWRFIGTQDWTGDAAAKMLAEGGVR